MDKFKLNWNEEEQRQASMSQRTRDLLLSWCEFSDKYVEEAGLLRDENDLIWTFARIFCIFIITPLISVAPFTVEVTDDPSQHVWLSVLYLSAVFSITTQLVGMVFRKAFIQMPFGIHNVLLMYTGIDFAIELVVFITTILILQCMFPKQLSARRILCGLIRTNAATMLLLIITTWLAFLSFQCFFLGIDTRNIHTQIFQF